MASESGFESASKLAFVHGRSVFESPEPRDDYLYYVFGTLEIVILVKGDKTNVNTMLLEPRGSDPNEKVVLK